MLAFEDPYQREQTTRCRTNPSNNPGYEGSGPRVQRRYQPNPFNHPRHLNLTQFSPPLSHMMDPQPRPGISAQHTGTQSHPSYLNPYLPMHQTPQQYSYMSTNPMCSVPMQTTPGPDPGFQFQLNDLDFLVSENEDASMNMNKGSQETTSYTKSMGSGSWEMVPTTPQSFSVISKETDMEGDEQYSAPSQGSGERMDIEGDMGGGRNMEMPQGEHNVLLGGLWSPTPRPVHNPYQIMAFDNALCESYIGNQPGMHAFPSRTGREHPWTPVEASMNPRMEAGLQYAAFAPSPGPAGEQDEEDILKGTATAVKSPSRNRNARASSKGRRTFGPNSKAMESGWEHTMMRGEKRVVVTERTKEIGRRHSGKRTGALAPQAAEKARRIRKLRACWSCWVSKVPCSEDTVCKRCSKNSHSHNLPPLHRCLRTGFNDFQRALFPGFLHTHLQKEQVANFLAENVHHFNEQVDVEITVGPAFGSLKLSAFIFEPRGTEILTDHRLVSEVEGKPFQVVSHDCLPVGICGLSTTELKRTCKNYLTDMVEADAFIEEVCGKDGTQIPRKILQSVIRYSASKTMPLVRSALMLYATHFYMRRVVTFMDESVKRIYQTMGSFESDEELESYLSSRLLNRQIKYVIYKIQQELTASVLEGLEKLLRSRARDSWAPSFCTILVLSLCIEHIETAADIFVVCDIAKETNGGFQSEYRRDQSSEACSELDNYPFRQCTQLFHDIFKSHREYNGGGKEAFNPLMSDVEMDENSGWDQATREMILSIRQIIRESDGEMIRLANNPTFLNSDFTVTPDSIKANNTGRLVSKFLKSFYST